MKNLIDDLVAGGTTGIGTALTASITEFQRVEEEGRTRTAFLLSDGQNNRGEDPRVAVERLQEMGIRVFTIPVGSAADRDLLSDIASETAGTMFDAPVGDELPPIYAELFARFRGESLALPRSESAVKGGIIIIQNEHNSPEGSLWDRAAKLAASLFSSWVGSAEAQQSLPETESFPFLVEEGATQLNVMLSARNLNVDDWDPGFRLVGPGGEMIDDTDTSGRVKRDQFYRLMQVLTPTPGEWTLEVFAKNSVEQRSFVLAHVENPAPDCFTDVQPRIADGNAPLSIGAVASFLVDLEGVDYNGSVRRPDGSVVPLSFERNPSTRTVMAEFDAFAGRGIYDVTVSCSAVEEAEPAPGEIIFDGAERAAVEIDPFDRIARTSFFLTVSDLPPCTNNDCDNDGIPNDVEGNDDFDSDGLPNDRDDDADGDDLPDAVEGTDDQDGDGKPDFLDVAVSSDPCIAISDLRADTKAAVIPGPSGEGMLAALDKALKFCTAAQDELAAGGTKRVEKNLGKSQEQLEKYINFLTKEKTKVAPGVAASLHAVAEEIITNIDAATVGL